MRIASPPVKFPCFYGIDTPNKDELLASKYSLREIRDYIGVDSLKFISLDGVYKALGHEKEETLKIQLILITILVVTILLNWLIMSLENHPLSCHYLLKVNSA